LLPPHTKAPPACPAASQMFVHTARDVNDGAAWAEQEAELGLFDAFFASLSMILVSEIGDETFIIAALMAMRHPKSIVLSGALSALVVMTVLSTGLGRIVPNLISRKHTNSAATVLYAFFGLRLLYIAWRSDSTASQEIEEVQEKLEAGQGKSTFRRIFSRFCTPIFLESFVLTFLAEWGDRSQIATIAVCLISLSKPTSQMCPCPIISILTCCMFQNAAGYAQECCGCCRRSNVGAHHLHVIRSGGWQHAGVEDISGHSSHHWRPPLPWLLCIIILLPTIVTTPLSFLLQFFRLLKITLPNPLSPRPIYQHMMLGIQIFCCTTIH
jgi:putative Ca2+/H+ antiporter (TMEM165/GDT1 family)